MRTVIIWEEFGERALCWFVVDGDKSYLNRQYLNSADISDEVADELQSLVYSEDGDVIANFSEDFNAMPRDDATIIVAGFFP